MRKEDIQSLRTKYVIRGCYKNARNYSGEPGKLSKFNMRYKKVSIWSEIQNPINVRKVWTKQEEWNVNDSLDTE